MKMSFRKQYAGLTIALIAGTVLMCWFINNTFLESYYERDKVQAVESAFLKLNQAVNNELLETDTFNQEMVAFAYRHNVSAAVIDLNSKMIFNVSFAGDNLSIKLMGYITGNLGENRENIPQANKVFKSIERRTGAEYIEMYGELDNGYIFIITSAMESIQASVRISNRFLAYIGLGATLLGGIFAWLLSKKFTEPVLELAHISERMIHLDFDAKYVGKENNELALLGNNINKLSESLEVTISELKTANNELQKDLEKKEKIDEMRKEFLSNVSHELKTPIALIQGYAEGLKDGINDDIESREFYCEVIIDEANRMNSMVKKLLVLNQLEFGTDVITMERIDIVALVRNYIQSAKILSIQNEIEVKIEQEEAIYVWADEFKMEEVIMNYFSNAINHCTGKKIIDIKFEKIDEKIRVSVFNTGDPIPEESIDHLFEKFYKVDKARTRAYGGSGIGLSIVKATMESMNQSCGVENFTNGVLFWFELEAVGVGE